MKENETTGRQPERAALRWIPAYTTPKRAAGRGVEEIKSYTPDDIAMTVIPGVRILEKIKGISGNNRRRAKKGRLDPAEPLCWFTTYAPFSAMVIKEKPESERTSVFLKTSW